MDDAHHRYADRLIDDLDRLDWPEPIKLNASATGSAAATAHGSTSTPLPARSPCFTTRPDTLFGAHVHGPGPRAPFVEALTTADNAEAVDAYRTAAAAKKDIDRQDEGREKTACSPARTPRTRTTVSRSRLDRRLRPDGLRHRRHHGGAVRRPARLRVRPPFGLPIPAIQQPPASWFADRGIDPSLDTATWPEASSATRRTSNSVNDTLSLDGLENVAEGKQRTAEWLSEHGHGEATVNFKLRDWLFSRQRYWGEPFPVLYDEDDMPFSVPDHLLPVLLPELEDFKPDGPRPRRRRPPTPSRRWHACRSG